ncbi:MAG: carboxypeptidase-like regulatory domain-containing protein [Mucilaginibacter sp.]
MNILYHLTRLIFLFFMFLGSALSGYGQDKELSGKVISETTKAALPYVNIRLSGGIGTVSNDDGMFVIKFPGNYTQSDSIIFSSVGYQPKAISIHDALEQNDFVISLSESIIALKEVVIKPLTVRQLLDSISRANAAAFNSPMKLDGYYREFVFTNTKCTEYADALFEYYYDRGVKSPGQLKIAASRCEKGAQKYDNSKNFEANLDSRVNPDKIFGYAMLSGLIKELFADKQLDGYEYNIEENKENSDLHITIFPKPGSDKVYQLSFLLSPGFALRSYKLEIPVKQLNNVKERSLLGIHGRTINFMVEANYGIDNGGIYPEYFRLTKDVKIYGKFLGVVLNQVTQQKSEFIVTGTETKNIAPFTKNETYKKGNICGNGIAINTALLKNYNFILPTKKDSLTIDSISKGNAPE